MDEDVDSIVKEFRTHAAFNHAVDKPVYHLSVSPAYADNLTDADWSELTDDILQKLELRGNQAIGVLHQDTYFPNDPKVRKHLHLVANAVDSQFKCSNFHYDYRKVEHVMRSFEAKKNLTEINEDYVIQDNQDKILDSEASTQAKPPKRKKIGSLIANQFGSRTGLLDSLESAEKVAKEIVTNDTAIDGFDLASIGITSASSLSKLATAFAAIAMSDKEREDIKLVEEITEEIAQKSNLPDLTSSQMQHVKPENIQSFVIQSASFIEDKVDFSIGKSNDHSKRLQAVKEKLEEKPPSLDSEAIYSKFLAYLRSSEKARRQKISYKYSLEDKQAEPFSRIRLTDLTKGKSIEVATNNKVLYKAVFKDNKWSEMENNLDRKNVRLINRLPQNEKDVANDYFAKYLVKQLMEKFRSNEKGKEVPWKYERGELEDREYVFKYAMNQKKDAAYIHGKDKDSKANIFEAEVFKDGVVSIVKNDIPIDRYKDLWKQSNRNKNQQNEQPKKISRQK